MDRLFRPAGVAVVGASPDPTKIGGMILGNIIGGGYKGGIYPVNPRGGEIQGHKAYPRMTDIPGTVDVAIIVVPAPLVAGVVEDCGRKGVGYLVVVTSGFGEVGNLEGEKELVRICRQYGMRLLGPNIFGLLYQGVDLNASFGPRDVLGGHVALITQSGALGVALIGKAVTSRLGLSAVVSVGNKADIDDSELLDYFAGDPLTRVILIYMEGLKDGPRFMEAVRSCVRRKPVIIIKSGRSARGAKAAASHTGSLAGFDSIYDAAFRQAGVLRADDIRQAFDWARSLSTLSVPKGHNTIILTNGGGVGVLATDACERSGLRLMGDTGRLRELFGPLIPDYGSTRNPIDLTGQGGIDSFSKCLEAALAEESIDSVVTLFCETASTDPEELAGRITGAEGMGMGEDGVVSPVKPVTFALVGGEAMEETLERLHAASVSAYPLPEDAVSALAVWHHRKRLLDTPRPVPEEFHIDRDLITRHTRDAIAERRSQLLEHEAAGVLSAIGVQGPRRFFASDLEEARQAARILGYPVVLKVVSEDVIHKSDAGGVVVGIGSEKELIDAHARIHSSCRARYPGANIRGMLVVEQADLEGGVEIIVGATKDPAFGPVVMFGLGGIFVEILKDVAFRVAPLDRREAMEIIRDTRAFPVLYGARGDTVKDIDSLADIVFRIGRLVSEVPAIVELDINPVIVYSRGRGCLPLDARITLDLSYPGSPGQPGPEEHHDHVRHEGSAAKSRRVEAEAAAQTGKTGGERR
jgi:acetyltransferase